MKDKIISTIAYLFHKRTITYMTMTGLIIYMVSTTIVNLEIKNKLEIEQLNKNKQNFISDKEKELKPLTDKQKQLKQELDGVLSKIEPLTKCIDGVRKTLNTREYFDCKKHGLIETASADEEIINTGGLMPDDLFYTTKKSDKCYVSQTEKQHFASNGRLASDVACPNKGPIEIYAPDYLNQSMEYDVDYKNFPDTGDTLILHFEYKGTKYFWLIGHVQPLGYMAMSRTGLMLGHMNLSGITTGYHSHIELWQGNNLDDAVKVSYSSSTRALMNMRQSKLDDTVKIGDPIYFTSYNIGDVSQNDSSPNIGASGIDLRTVKNPIALTVDIRNLYGIKFGDKIKMDGPCSGIYEVHDEKNSRYRYSCIKEQGVCNKGDIAIPKDSKNLSCSGIYKITKL